MGSTSEIITNGDGSAEAGIESRDRRPRHTGVLIAGLVAALTVVTATTLGLWASAGASGEETVDRQAPAAPLAGYQPGGSVYQQQVPDAGPGPEMHHSERGGGGFVAAPSC